MTQTGERAPGARTIEAIHPLSPAQQGILFHSVESPDERSYHCRALYRLRGRVELGALRAAFAHALRRHEALRTAFLWQEAERPVQVVLRAEHVTLPFEEEDWTGLDEAVRLARLAELLERDTAQGFRLESAPLLRLRALRLAPDECYVLLSHHHLILDGWSLALLLREVLDAVEAQGRGEPLRSDPAPRYGDFVRRIAESDAAAAQRYWREQLGAGRARTPLPCDRALAELPGGGLRLAETVRRLDGVQTQRWLRIARERGVTLGALLQAAWALVLGRFAGTRDVVVGVALSGRSAAARGDEQRIGLLMSSLPLRVRWSAADTPAALLRALHAQGAALREHEGSALRDIHRWCECERAFDSLLVLDNFPLQGLGRERGVALRALPLGAAEQALLDAWSAQRNHYPLTLVAVPGEALQLRLAWDRRRFSPQRAEQLLGALERAALQLGEVNRLGELRLGGWDAGQPVAPAVLPSAAAAPSLAARVAGWARSRPDQPALIVAEHTLSWRELEEHSRRAAGALRARGCGRETRVALTLPRGLEWVVTLLGVLRAGGCAVPLAVEGAPERLRFCLRDSGAELAIAPDPARAEALRALGVRQVVEWDALLAEGAAAPRAELPQAHPLQLAYLLYTSGSTGAPKGVAVSHGALLAYLDAIDSRLPLPADARWAWLSSPVADLGHTALFGALASGRALIVVPEHEGDDPERVAARLEAGGCDALKIAPSQLRALLGAARDPARLIPRRLLVLGGEPLTPELVRRVRALRPGCAIANHYGPTETTVGASAHALPGDGSGADPEYGETLPIGAPLAHARAAVLDCEGQPVPAGVPGELCIGGPALARGYLGRAGLTAERFAPDPREPGARLYRTGDRVLWREGALEFLGRIDAQLKVHGFRVEPGEVESALRALPGVRAAAVAQVQPGAALTACVVPERPGALDPLGARKALERALPAALVPASWVELAALPLLPSGKLDRTALLRATPVPGGDGRAAFEAPRGPLEQALARIWESVLEGGPVGANERFFELGGDSILSLQLVARARREGIRFTPRQLFEHPTIAELARVAEWSGAPEPGAGADPRAQSEAPLSPIQHWFFAQALARPAHFNQSLLLPLRRALDAAQLERALAAVLERHPALRTRFERAGEEGWRQRPGAGEALALRRVDLRALQPAVRRARVEASCAQAQRGLDLERGRLFAALLFELDAAEGEPQGLLFLVAHHLAIDAVSWRIALDDLVRAYGGGALPAAPCAYGLWSEQLARWAPTPALAEQRPFWLAQVPSGRLPRDFPGTALPRHGELAELRVKLGADETARLERALAQTLRGSVRDAVAFALVRALARWSGTPEVAIELEGHGRETPGGAALDLSQTVGWFTARYPLRFDAAPGEPATRALLRVKEQLRAVPDGGLGYGALRYLAPAGEELAALPAPEVALNFLGSLDRGLPGAVLAPPEGWGALGAPSMGAQRDPDGIRAALLSVVAQVAAGELRFTWSHGVRAHRPETIAALAQDALAELRELLRACEDAPLGLASAGDFPLSGLSGAELDGLGLDYREVEDVLRCSPLQEGLLFHAQLDARAYVNQLSVEARPLDVSRLERAWQRLAQRHAILRTAFAWEERADAGRPAALRWPVQIVWRRAAVDLRVLDWRGLDRADQESRWQRELESDRERGYALDAAPLWRVLVADCGERGARVLWSRHHALLDGWSSSQLLGEWLRIYRALGAGEGDAALPPARPFRDHIAWLAGRDTQAALASFDAALAGWSEPTPLPLGEPGAAGAAPAERPREAVALLPAERWAALRAFAAAQGVTPSTLCQGAWALLLARTAGTRDVVFGVTIAGRPAELDGAEGMLGLFINSLPLRVHTPAVQPLGAWLTELQRRVLALQECGFVSLAQLQARRRQAGARGPLFESLLVYESYPLEPALANGDAELGVRAAEVRDGTHYPLTAVLVPGPESLRVTLQYAPARLAPARAQRALELYVELLAELPRRSAQRPLGALGLPGAPQPMRPAALPALAPGASLIALFRAQARQRGDAVALRFRGHSVSYRELEVRALALGAALRARGVGPEVRVALRLPRSPELIAGLLGVLTAGGTYVPLDPAWPPARQRQLVRSAGARWVLDAAPEGSAAEDWGVPRLALAELEAQGRSLPAPPPVAHPEQLAYVIHTSGSTGEPKGVGVAHAQVLQLLRACEPAPGFRPDDVWTLFHSVAFDFSVWEVWGALAHGGALAIVPESVCRDPLALARLLRDERVSVLSQTPSAFFALCEALLPGAEGATEEASAPRAPCTAERGWALRAVVFGGEALDRRRLARWYAVHGESGPRLHNLYGITETTVHATWTPLSAASCADGGLGIGAPLAHLSAQVLDAEGNPAPPGVAGELHVGGGGLARGYLERPAWTAARFVPDPFGAPGARLYRSGDAARWSARGELEYLGRLDGQVKLRGYRIEVGEVAAALRADARVRDAAVLLRAGRGVGGEGELVACVVPQGDAGDGGALADALRGRLAEQLPQYMVPSRWRTVAALPLTPNGKLDAAELLAPLEDAPGSGSGDAAPQGELERELAAEIAELLGLERVGRHDDFFAIGGHSLAAMRLLPRVQRRFATAIPLAELFEQPTVAGLAQRIRERRDRAAGDVAELAALLDAVESGEGSA